jgi:competence protein ComEC
VHYLLHFFISGIFLGSLIFNYIPNINIVFLLSFLSVNIFISSLIKNSKYLKLTSLLILISSITLLRGILIFPLPEIPHTKETSFSGTIVSEPDIRETTTRLVVDVENYNEKIILITNHYPKRNIGDVLEFSGKIKLPENFENENGIEFDYINYLAKDRIFSFIYRPKISLIEESEGGIVNKIFWIKNSFLEKIQSTIPSPESELLGGILLGTKRSLGSDWEEKFRKTGLIHIVVLSGYNITIIADAIFRFFGFLPKIFSVTLSVICIIIFAIMVGSGATIIRATIMTLLAVLARVTGRTYAVNRALFLAAGVMVFHNPMILIHDPSFQLSFLATLGLINLSDVVKKVLRFIPEKFELREISTATLATQISVLPLLLTMTGELSIVSPVVNILTLQVIPITMLLGFISGLASFINEQIGLYIGVLPYIFLKYILTIVDFFAGFEFAVWKF